jgi:uncharacterized protein YbjQ (UPF0145 family)
MSQQMPPQGPYGQPAPAQGSTIPQRAQARLSAMRGDARHRGLATSDLSINEFVLTRQAGFEPLGMVMGTSIYHVGWQIMKFNTSQEVPVLTQAMYNARELAMARMVEEANLLGADGIVGVQLAINSQEWESELSEFVAIGTAIRARNGQSYRNAQGRPFTSALSGQDFWTLLQAGYLPVGMVMGNCVYHIAHMGMAPWFKQIGRNVELTLYTQGVYEARELAMERMQAEAATLQATNIVGVSISEDNYAWESHVIEFFTLGTAVVPLATDHTMPTPSLTLPLNG